MSLKKEVLGGSKGDLLKVELSPREEVKAVVCTATCEGGKTQMIVEGSTADIVNLVGSMEVALFKELTLPLDSKRLRLKLVKDMHKMVIKHLEDELEDEEDDGVAEDLGKLFKKLLGDLEDIFEKDKEDEKEEKGGRW